MFKAYSNLAILFKIVCFTHPSIKKILTYLWQLLGVNLWFQILLFNAPGVFNVVTSKNVILTTKTRQELITFSSDKKSQLLQKKCLKVIATD